MTDADHHAARASTDTIAAIATAAGPGGVGIVRLSGPASAAIASALCGTLPAPRTAGHRRFRDAHGGVIDDGLVLHFPAPGSYTGEDVVELQAHGGPVLLAQLLGRCLALGARPARPGEFTERAFLAGRLDLAQAEAVADLIGAASAQAARAARRALDGAFSTRVDAIADALLGLRVQVEAAIDFPDEDIDPLAAPALAARLDEAHAALDALLAAAERGRRLASGLHVVLCGAPNAGKSSLLNALAGEDRAIVSAAPGTTRDLLRERLSIGGLDLVLVDTAGLRDSPDEVEREGMRRALDELSRADLVLAVRDASDPAPPPPALLAAVAGAAEVLWLHAKSDRADARPPPDAPGHLAVSAFTGKGLDALAAALRERAGLGDGVEDAFTARARHLDALRACLALLDEARQRRREGLAELVAEALRLAHDALGRITGRVHPDDLLGEVFARFCIGK